VLCVRNVLVLLLNFYIIPLCQIAHEFLACACDRAEKHPVRTNMIAQKNIIRTHAITTKNQREAPERAHIARDHRSDIICEMLSLHMKILMKLCTYHM